MYGASIQAPRLFFLAFALLCTGTLAVVFYIAPLNCNDMLQHLFWFETQSPYDLFHHEFVNRRGASADWRPLQFPIGYALYHAFKGYEHLVFKGLLVLFLFLTTWLLVLAMPVRRWADAWAAAIAVLILFGHQSFAGAVEGVYPYGVEIMLVACEFAILVILMRDRPSFATGATALLVSLFAILLNEKGGLVGATYIVGAVLRLPGGSIRAAAAVLCAYLAVVAFRFGYMTPNITSLGQRDFASDPAQILLDAVAPPLNILISDPRFGKFRTFAQALTGEHPWAMVTVVTSLMILGIIVAWAVRTFDPRNVSSELKVGALLIVTLVGSVMFGVFSQKDYIPVMALPVYVLVSFYALRWLFAQRIMAISIVVGFVLVAGWGIRTAGLFYYMQRMAYGSYVEWTDHAERLGRFSEFDPAMARPILERLKAEATKTKVTDPDDLIPERIVLWLRGRGCPELCR